MERNRWQLIRMLTNEEKSKVSKDRRCEKEWMEKMEQKYDIVYTKMIKIGKEWKMIAYFRTETNVMRTLDKVIKGEAYDIRWKFRTFKELYKMAPKEKTTGANKTLVKVTRINLEESPSPNHRYREINIDIPVNKW